MSLLRIYFSAQWRDASSSCPWALGDETGTVLQSGESSLAGLPQADEYIAIIAADRITCVNVPAPIKARRRWEAALPFIAEEFSLAEPEHNHVVPGVAQADNIHPLAIIDKAWLGSIVAACREANRPLRRALPETFLPPLAPNTWVLVWDGHGGFMRTNEASGLALDSGDAQHAPLALKLSLQAAHPEKIELRFPAHGNEPELPDWGELPVAIHIGEPWDWRNVAIPKQALNLLWGKFAPPIRLMEWLPGLRVPLLILCAALMLEAVATNIEWLRLASERRSLMQQMERDFRAPFGEGSAIADPVIQMQRNLATLHHAAGLPDESDFLPLLEGSIGAFTELPGRRVRAIHYETGRLDLDVHLCSINKLELLQKHLKRHGFSVRTGGIQKTTDGIDVRLTLQYGGGL